MVHELIGLRNNRVDLSRCPGITKELQVSKFAFLPLGWKFIDIMLILLFIRWRTLDLGFRGFTTTEVYFDFLSRNWKRTGTGFYLLIIAVYAHNLLVCFHTPATELIKSLNNEQWTITVALESGPLDLFRKLRMSKLNKNKLKWRKICFSCC